MLTRSRSWCHFIAVVGVGLAISCSRDERELSVSAIPITVPTGFSDHVITTAVVEPIALDFLPDGTMLVLSRRGKVHVVSSGAGAPTVTVALDLSSKVCSNRERGLLGVAVDPEFATTHDVFLYYTFKKNSGANCPIGDPDGQDVVNRVARYDYDAATRTLQNETLVLDNILSNNGWHNAGDLEFGPDGYLYVSVGDSGADLDSNATGWGNGNARHKSILQGKVLRVRKDNGEPAPGNPWISAPGSRRCAAPGQAPQYPHDDSKPCRETYAWGFRNPYRLAFQRGSGRLFINDVGQNIGGDWEEIDTGQPGADYGWNDNQGPTSDSGTTGPTHAYEIGMEVDGVACRCITGGAFVVDGSWGSTYDGSYLFADYTCGTVFRIKQQNGNWTRTPFARGFGESSVVNLRVGPNPAGGQSLYYLSFNGNKLGRIDGPSVNSAPVAELTASPTSGPAPLAVTFDGSGSHDGEPSGRITSYAWDFGDGATQTTTTATATHTYTRAGSFNATLTVTDNGQPPLTDSASVAIFPGNRPPTVTITSPADGSPFVVGEAVTLHATATDPDDGALPASALSWTVQKVHADHTHPFASETGNDVQVVPDGPEDLAAVGTSHLRVAVTATDSSGQEGSDQIDLTPTVVPISIATEPTGLMLTVNGVAQAAPSTFDAWQGWQLPLAAQPQTVGDTTYVFDHWSDGEAAAHAVVVPATATTYTATFRAAGPPIRINFQPAGAPVPDGYLVDDGAAFGPREGGIEYGWDRMNPLSRDRDVHQDQRYDTTILMEKDGETYSWEIALPEGEYQVHLVAGDAQYADGSYHVVAEGEPFLDGTPSDAEHFVEVTRNVVVRDGRLTLGNGEGSVLTRLCFIDILRLGDGAVTDSDAGPGGGGGGGGAVGGCCSASDAPAAPPLALISLVALALLRPRRGARRAGARRAPT